MITGRHLRKMAIAATVTALMNISLFGGEVKTYPADGKGDKVLGYKKLENSFGITTSHEGNTVYVNRSEEPLERVFGATEDGKEKVEVMKNNTVIVDGGILTTNGYWDEKGEKKDVSVSREYIRFLSGKEYRVKKIEQDETGIIETPFSLNYIPVVKFEFNSNIYSALNIVDKINETEAYIRSIFSIHGDPDLHASNIPPYAGTTDKGKAEAQALLEANYKKKKIIFTQDGSDQLQGKFKYIELTNPLIVEMQNDISRNERRLYTLFPEMLLVDTSTQNVSSETFSMKNNGLRAKISDFRASVLKGIMQLDNTALELLSKVERTTIEDYNFLDPFEEEERQKRINNINLALDIITKAKSIDTEQALSKIIDSISKDTLKELSELYD